MSKYVVDKIQEALDMYLTDTLDHPKVGGLIQLTCDLFSLSPGHNVWGSQTNIWGGFKDVTSDSSILNTVK